MFKKRIFCAALCLILLVGLVGCKKTDSLVSTEPAEVIDWMPFGLEFGMSYDAFAAKMKDAGFTVSALRPADANDGYVVDGFHLDTATLSHWEFLHSETINTMVKTDDHEDFDMSMNDLDFTCCSPKIYFSFNQDKELYEFYFMAAVFSEDTDFAKMLTHEFVAAYTEKFGIPCDSRNTWNTNNITGSITFYDGNTFCFVLHDTSHNLKN